jgi:5,6-dimethylbenzimidazole synthase
VVTPPVFDNAFRAGFLDLLNWRRDVREFLTDPIPEGMFETLVGTASLAPSVGLSQPWRFVLVDDPARREVVRQSFETCNREALACQHGERAALYARLKLAGLSQAPVQFALYADIETQQGHTLGRRTMPETAVYSAVAAVQILWLAARIEGLGLGWVSILDPTAVDAALAVPAGWAFVGYFCLGYPAHPDDTPALERVGWEHRHDPREFILRR